MRLSAFLIVLFGSHEIFTECHRILGVFQHTGSSHFIVFKPLLRKLAEMGHDITVISHFPLDDPPKNYKDISLRGSAPILLAAFDFNSYTSFTWTERIMRHVVTANTISTLGTTTCEAMLKNSEVKALKRGEFDLIITEDFSSDCSRGLVYKLKVPYISICSHVFVPWAMTNYGLITNPSYIANPYLEHGYKPNTLETLEGYLVTEYFMWYYYFFSQIPEQKMVEEFLGEKIPPLGTIAREGSLMLVNTHFSLNGAYPYPPNIIEIGGIHLNKHKELPQDIKKFLDEATQGVILFSMGSLLKSTSWPKEKLVILQDVLKELPHKIIWKWENDIMEGKPNNVKISKWIPQYDILCHKNVKAFITHAGMAGIVEAIDCGVPTLAIPIFGDQFCNAAALQNSGRGISVKFENITRESIKWALDVLLKPETKIQIEKLSAIWKDRPMSPMDTAIYWIEHVIRNGGRHLQPTSKDLPLYRYLLLDVIAILILILTIIVYTIYTILRCSLKIIRGNNKKTKKD